MIQKAAQAPAGPFNLRKAAADLIEDFVEVTLRVKPHLTRLEAACQVYDEHPDLLLIDYMGADLGEPMPVPGSRDPKAAVEDE